MANSSFFKNTGTSTQIQGSASASAAAALASEQAALASENAAQTSETNAAASAAAALVSKNAAASSAASANSDASAAATSATTSQTAATSSSANAASTSADATQTAADRVQTGLDRIATAADAVQTAADRVQTGLDVTSSSASAAAALSSRNAAATSETNAAASAASSSADATATASDRVQTGLDAASTAADAIATAADRVQTGLDVTSASNSASAASTSATAAAASQVSAASSAASAAAVFNDFEDRYYGPHASDSAAQTHVTGLGLTVDQGDLYFNSTANEMRVFDGGSWIAASSAGGASLINYNYTATASQTAFSGSDDNSNTLSYTVDNLIVTRNGVVLEDGTDYTATDGSTITLAVAAAAGDEINVVAFKSFTTADMVSATNGGTFQSNVTVNGTMTATAFSGDGSALTGITIPTLSSLGIANHDQVTVTAGGAVTATSFSGDGSSLTGIPTPTLTSLGIDNHDDITVDGSGNVTLLGNLQTAAAGRIYSGTGGNASSPMIANVSDTNTGIHFPAADTMALGTGGTTRIYMSSNGYVGIGGQSPNETLDVKGSTRLGNRITSATDYSTELSGFGVISGAQRYGSYGMLNFYATSGYTGGARTYAITNAYEANKFAILYGNNSTTLPSIGSGGSVVDGGLALAIDGSGKVGIGGSPSELLHIKNASGDAAVRIDGSTRSFKIEQNNYGLRFADVSAGSAERLRINAAGIVTMPYQPSFAASRSQGDVSGAVYVYPNAYHNTGNHYNNTNGRFTAPVTGSYLISLNHMSSNAGTYNNYEYELRVNGSVHQLVYGSNGTSVHHRWNWHGVIYLQAGDYVDVNVPSYFSLYGGANLYTHFSGYLIG